MNKHLNLSAALILLVSGAPQAASAETIEGTRLNLQDMGSGQSASSIPLDSARELAELVKKGFIQLDPTTGLMLVRPKDLSVINFYINSNKNQTALQKSKLTISTEALSHLNSVEQESLKSLLSRAKVNVVLFRGTETEVGAEK